MTRLALSAITLAIARLLAGPAAAADADNSHMMSHCNTYAAKHLGISTSDVATVTYEGQRTDGTHAVNGDTTTGITFQRSFGPQGHRVVIWTHSAPADCPPDVSEVNRYLYPPCH